ncbi:MAG: murein biosynthesis integral membrane protein MurJ [Candidatus Eisenbacteria bacterium]
MSSRADKAAVGLGAAALLMAASGLLSRLLGYGREILLAYFVGVGRESDAYFAAFVLPDLLNYLIAGGALSIAFLPIYAQAREREGEEAAARLLATTLGNLGLIVCVATAILWIFADPLIRLQFPEFDAETHALTVEITRIVAPAQVFFFLGGVIKATLFARGRFGAAALAPLIYNLGIILGGVLLYGRFGIHGFAWGVLVGAAAGPFLAPFLDSRRDGRPGVRIALLDPGFRRYLWVAAPLMFGQSLLTVDEWFDKWFGALIQPGAVAWLSYARKLMLIPVAVVGQAIATAALPTLTRLFEQKRNEELAETVERTLRAALGLAIVGGAALAAIAEPFVRFAYERGQWDGSDTVVVASILRILAFAVPGWIVQQIAVRPFYARGDTWRPMVLGTVVVLAAIPLYWRLSTSFGVEGLAWAGVIGMTVNAVATLLLARKLHGAPRFTPLIVSGVRAGLLAGPAWLAARYSATWLFGSAPNSGALHLPGGTPGALLQVAIVAGVFALVTVLLMPFLGDPELRALLVRRLRIKRWTSRA